MTISQQEVNQRIIDEIIYIQANLDTTWLHAIEQDGSNLNISWREEFYRKIEDTKQLLEQLKSKYL